MHDSSAREPGGRSWYPWYVVGVLTLFSVSGNIDQQILSLLIRPIERDFHLSDSQFGYLGGIARGAVFGTAGVFLVVAGINASPHQAKGVDSALRTLARTPAGPWLLVAVAAGLILFGAYSFCESRWREV